MNILFSIILCFLWLIVSVLFLAVRQLSKEVTALHARFEKIESKILPSKPEGTP